MNTLYNFFLSVQKNLEEAEVFDPFQETIQIFEDVLKKELRTIIMDNIKIKEKEQNKILKIISERKKGVPLPYILGKIYFMNLKLKIEKGVFIPRQETETIIYKIIDLYKNKNEPLSILDIGTGTGAIALSLKEYFKNSKVYSIDITQKACFIAKENSEMNNIKIDIVRGDLLSPFKFYSFDLIVSNPPYIPFKEIKKLQKEVQKEPLSSLNGGKDGLYFYKVFAKEINKYLKNGGYFVIEINPFLKERIASMFNLFYVQTIYDYSGFARGIIFKK